MGLIAITVDGRPALTTRQLAEEFGIDPASVRKAVQRLNLNPVEHLDERTPLYDADAARSAMDTRPGKGAPGRPRSTATATDR